MLNPIASILAQSVHQPHPNKFSPLNIRLASKEVGFFTDTLQIGTHVNGFRYPLIEKCKIESVGDLRFVEGNPPQAVCCAKINVVWVITRKSSFSMCSPKKLLVECKFEIKLIKRKIREKCQMENQFLKIVEAAQIE